MHQHPQWEGRARTAMSGSRVKNKLLRPFDGRRLKPGPSQQPKRLSALGMFRPKEKPNKVHQEESGSGSRHMSTSGRLTSGARTIAAVPRIGPAPSRDGKSVRGASFGTETMSVVSGVGSTSLRDRIRADPRRARGTSYRRGGGEQYVNAHCRRPYWARLPFLSISMYFHPVPPI